jgi:nicotinate phosphoribosyltransferase
MPTTPHSDTALLTDRYELTMLASFVADGTVGRRAVFEAFARRLPAGRRYGIVAGLGRLLPLIEDFTFDHGQLEWLQGEGVIDEATAAYLCDFRFAGDVQAVPEGDLYFPNTPVLTVSGTLGECIVLETLVLSVLNHDTAIASAAARMVTAAAGRPIIEMGSRRTHEEAAVATARAAYIAGFASTSNLAAGRRFGIPTVGTAAHAFTLAHESEEEAFRAQIATHGVGTTLLVDTYDVPTGIRTGVAVAQEFGATGPGAVRLDSGDLAEEARKARALLDDLGATGTRITVTSDLDEYVMATLADTPIDGYGAGTRVATGSGHPTAGMVYKLVAIERPDGSMRPVAKKSHGKPSLGGRKTVHRTFDSAGLLVAEDHTLDATTPLPGVPAAAGRQLAHHIVMQGGRAISGSGLHDARALCADALASLPAAAHNVTDGQPWLVPTITTVALQEA